MNDDEKTTKIILFIVTSVVAFISGFLLTLIICIDKVYAAQVELDYTKFNINVINGYSNSIFSGPINLNTNYGDNNYNVTCTSNYCTKYYSIHTNRAINSGTYTFELRFWFDYNSSYQTGLKSSDFRFYWGPSQNNITNQFTPDNLSINVVSYGTGGTWDAHQEYVITGNFTFGNANFLEIYIGDTRFQQTSIYISDLNIYSGDVSGMILSGLGDIVASNNANTQNIINNNNTNTQSIINNQNSNNQNIINNDNSNTQSIIDNQNQNAEEINTNIKDGLISCGMNLVTNNDLNIGSINASNGLDINSVSSRIRSIYIPVEKLTYQFYINEPYLLDVLFYYQDGSYLNSRNYRTNTGSFKISDERITDIRFRICMNDGNGACNGNYTFTNTDLSNIRLRVWSDEQCVSKLDEVNDNLNNLDNGVNNLNNNIMNSDVDDPTNTISGLNNSIQSNGTVSSLFLLPVNLFQIIITSLSSNTCNSITLGQLYGTNLNLPCIDIKSRIGNWIYNIIDYLCCFMLIISTGRLFFKVYDGMTSLGDVQNLEGVL